MKAINLIPKSVSRELKLELMSSQILNFWLWVVCSLAVFFALTLATMFVIRSDIGKVDVTIIGQKAILSAKNTKELETAVRSLNRDIATIHNLRAQHYNFSLALEEIANIFPDDLHLDSMTVNRFTGEFEVIGHGGARENILLFWSNLTQSEKFTKVNFPLTNLDQAQADTFNFRFYLNPQTIQNDTTN